MARAPQRQGTPAPPPKQKKYISFGTFKKMNTKVIRPALSEDELAWLENMIIFGPNNIQSVPAALAPIVFINAETPYRAYWANFGSTDYLIVFTVAGAGWSINLTNNSSTKFAADGTFTNPDMTVYASERILIIDPTGGYCTWDGSIFVAAGAVSPNITVTAGGTYSSTPTVTITGGSGVGVTASAVMSGSGSNQTVVGVTLITPGTGYLPGDTLTVNFSGSGGATATAHVWPTTSGTSITVFSGRVWWCRAPSFPPGSNVRQLNFTGTAGYDDMNPADAAGSTTITDQDVAHNLTALRGLNNYLYIFGDNSLKQIGSISVSNSITLFTILTIASDIGTTFIQTILSFNRYTVFANKNGVYGVFGASVQKISDDLDGIFESVNFSLQMCGALNDIHLGITAGGSLHCYLLLVSYEDPIEDITRTILCGFDGKSWFVVSQGNSIECITSLPSGVTNQWETYSFYPISGVSGFYVQQLLQDNTTPVPVTLRTSLTPHQSVWMAKQPLHVGSGMNFGSAEQPTVTISLDTENESFSVGFLAPGNESGFFFVHSSVEGYGHYLGCTIETSALLLTISSIAIEYVEADPWGDVFPAPAQILLTSESGVLLTSESGLNLIAG